MLTEFMKDILRRSRRLLVIATVGIVSATVGGFSISPAEAATYNLDFEYLDLDTQQNEITDSRGGNRRVGIRNQWKNNYGLKIRGYNQSETESKPLLLFDSNPNTYTGGDDDLRSGTDWGTPEQGNILIIHERGWEELSNGKQGFLITTIQMMTEMEESSNLISLTQARVMDW